MHTAAQSRLTLAGTAPLVLAGIAGGTVVVAPADEFHHSGCATGGSLESGPDVAHGAPGWIQLLNLGDA